MDEENSDFGIDVAADDLGIPPERRPEKTVDCIIPKADRGEIKEFKAMYIRQITKAARKQIFRGEILPRIFDHWAKIGDRPKDVEEAAGRIKKLALWLSNNWRPIVTQEASRKGGFKVTEAQIIYREHRELVDAETRKRFAMEGSEELDYSKQDIFAYRTTAIRLVKEQMSVGQREELAARVLQCKGNGLPPEIQRQYVAVSLDTIRICSLTRRAVPFIYDSLAHTKLDQRIESFEQDRWREMGAVMLTFVGFKSTDGAYIVDRFDNIANIMGVPAQPFVDSEKNKVDEIKRLLIAYIKNIDRTANGIRSNPPDAMRPNDQKIQMNDKGYPILPTTVDFEKLNKVDLTDMMRMFFNAHYKLASGSTRSVPYKAIQSDTSRFIEKQYLPTNLVIKEVKNMQKEDVVRFLEHVRERQVRLCAEDAFRFSIYIKKQTHHPAKYPAEPQGKNSKGKSKRSSKKGKNRTEEATLVQNQDETAAYNREKTAPASTAAAISPTAAATSPSAAATSPTAAATSPSAAATSPTAAATSPSAAETSPTAAVRTAASLSGDSDVSAKTPSRKGKKRLAIASPRTTASDSGKDNVLAITNSGKGKKRTLPTTSPMTTAPASENEELPVIPKGKGKKRTLPNLSPAKNPAAAIPTRKSNRKNQTSTGYFLRERRS